MVLRVNRAGHSVLISHRDIPHYMPAMAMDFAAAKAERLDGLIPGTRVRFRLSVSRGRSAISRIEPLAPAAEFPGLAPAPMPIGTLVPDFTLLDQTGMPVTLSGLRGRVIAVDFIYTRCPLPDVCPRLSANFRRLQRRFGERVTLLSITLDPRFDTPEVLARYGKLWNADSSGWKFLTGSPAAVEAVAKQFGLFYFAEEGSMTHTTLTAVISRTGYLAGRVDGPGYAVSQLGDLISKELEAK